MNQEFLCEQLIDSYYKIQLNEDNETKISNINEHYIKNLEDWIEKKKTALDKSIYDRKITALLSKIGRLNILKLIELNKNLSNTSKSDYAMIDF